MAALVRIYPGDLLRLRYVASVAPAEVEAVIIPDERDGTMGSWSQIIVNTFTTNRTVILAQEEASGGGAGTCEISGGVTKRGGTVKRGQFYVRLTLARQGVAFEDCLCCGYLYDSRPELAVGEHIEPGPGGGEGFLAIEGVNNRAGNVATSQVLGIANTIRRIHGFVIYYNASGDAATRTIAPTLRQPFSALPTGFATAANADVWVSLTLSLTLSQEGTIYVTDEYTAKNENGTITVSSQATAPNPFPFLVLESGTVTTLELTVGSGNANDVYSLGIFVEEWLVL